MKYFAIGQAVYQQDGSALNRKAAVCDSINLAKRIANALNLYRPKVRRRKKSAEKAVISRH